MKHTYIIVQIMIVMIISCRDKSTNLEKQYVIDGTYEKKDTINKVGDRQCFTISDSDSCLFKSYNDTFYKGRCIELDLFLTNSDDRHFSRKIYMITDSTTGELKSLVLNEGEFIQVKASKQHPEPYRYRNENAHIEIHVDSNKVKELRQSIFY